MERRGFVDGAVVLLRQLHRQVCVATDPLLAVSIRYFLASFLTLRGELEEARELTDEGLLLAWEHDAKEELELLEQLAAQLGI
jgi:hypothetical protein